MSPLLPPRVADVFRRTPAELIGLCRPHPWDQLTAAPAAGLRSIRDILAHLIDAESGWIGYVIERRPRVKADPASFGSLDQLLAAWVPQRESSLALILWLTPEARLERRPLPWDAAATASVEEIVWHVVAHEQYHRGQVFTRLALLGRRDLPDHDLLRAAP
jgi:uncharacterized damage-inducible protein DinB